MNDVGLSPQADVAIDTVTDDVGVLMRISAKSVSARQSLQFFFYQSLLVSSQLGVVIITVMIKG